MSYGFGEALGTVTPATAEQMHVSVFNPDGSINEGTVETMYGLGIQEAEQIVSFGGHTGTVAQMLDDPKCPVGGMVRKAYEADGLEGVVKKLDGLSAVDEQFKVAISQTTVERELLKKKLMRRVS